MTGFLIDTNCLSEVVRVKPEPRVMAWIEAAEETLLYLSILTFGEIRKGLAALPQGKRRSRLETWLEVELRARFSGRILPIDAAVADRWGLLAENAKSKGKPLSAINGLLAATAIHHNLTIVSRNVGELYKYTSVGRESVGTLMSAITP
jgi:predicted nucleic acid-binding protein